MSWTTETLNGTNLLRRRLVDTTRPGAVPGAIGDALFDPSKGSEAVHLGPQHYSHDFWGGSGPTGTTDIDVREVAPGLWFPVR